MRDASQQLPHGQEKLTSPQSDLSKVRIRVRKHVSGLTILIGSGYNTWRSALPSGWRIIRGYVTTTSRKGVSIVEPGYIVIDNYNSVLGFLVRGPTAAQFLKWINVVKRKRLEKLHDKNAVWWSRKRKRPRFRIDIP